MTLVLGAFMFLTLGRGETQTSVQEEASGAIDAQAYRKELLSLAATFQTDIASAPDDLTKLVVAQRALENLLSLRVPPEFKEPHLRFALILTRIQNTLTSGDRDIASALADLQTLRESL